MMILGVLLLVVGAALAQEMMLNQMTFNSLPILNANTVLLRPNTAYTVLSRIAVPDTGLPLAIDGGGSTITCAVSDGCFAWSLVQPLTFKNLTVNFNNASFRHLVQTPMTTTSSHAAITLDSVTFQADNAFLFFTPTGSATTASSFHVFVSFERCSGTLRALSPELIVREGGSAEVEVRDSALRFSAFSFVGTPTSKVSLVRSTLSGSFNVSRAAVLVDNCTLSDATLSLEQTAMATVTGMTILPHTVTMGCIRSALLVRGGGISIDGVTATGVNVCGGRSLLAFADCSSVNLTASAFVGLAADHIIELRNVAFFGLNSSRFEKLRSEEIGAIFSTGGQRGAMLLTSFVGNTRTLIASDAAQWSIDACRFEDNNSTTPLLLLESSAIVLFLITNTRFANNTAPYVVQTGGSAVVRRTTASLINVEFNGNKAKALLRAADSHNNVAFDKVTTSSNTVDALFVVNSAVLVIDSPCWCSNVLSLFEVACVAPAITSSTASVTTNCTSQALPQTPSCNTDCARTTRAPAHTGIGTWTLATGTTTVAATIPVTVIAIRPATGPTKINASSTNGTAVATASGGDNGAIIGAVVGGALGALLLAGVVVLIAKTQRAKHRDVDEPTSMKQGPTEYVDVSAVRQGGSDYGQSQFGGLE